MQDSKIARFSRFPPRSCGYAHRSLPAPPPGLDWRSTGDQFADVLLLLDNYDSFTYNLVQYFGELGVLPEVFRNDRITVGEAVAKNPSALVISPGPCSPNEAGESLAVIAEFAGRVPILGVCLGHQCVGQHFGGRVVRAERLMHGKTSPIHHRGEGVFAGIPDPFEATRYHSLIVERASVPSCLHVTAETAEGEIMGLQHKMMPIHGVQFHPESLATAEGKKILANFLVLSGLLSGDMARTSSTSTKSL